MVVSIKQEPVECTIEQPPLKKIKQEVLSTQHKHVHIRKQAGKCEAGVLLCYLQVTVVKEATFDS